MATRDAFQNPLCLWDFTKVGTGFVVPETIQTMNPATARVKSSQTSYPRYLLSPDLIGGWDYGKTVKCSDIPAPTTAYQLPNYISYPDQFTIAVLWGPMDSNSFTVFSNPSEKWIDLDPAGGWNVNGAFSVSGITYPGATPRAANVYALSIDKVGLKWTAMRNGLTKSGTISASIITSLPTNFSQIGWTDGSGTSVGRGNSHTYVGLWNSYQTEAQMVAAYPLLLEEYYFKPGKSVYSHPAVNAVQNAVKPWRQNYSRRPLDLQTSWPIYNGSAQGVNVAKFVKMTGFTKVEGVPVSRRVVVLDDIGYQKVGSVISRPDGFFEFPGLIPGRKYTAIAIPLTGDNYPPTVQTKIVA